MGGNFWATGMRSGNNKKNNGYFQIVATIVERIRRLGIERWMLVQVL
jgi:hypothetical protein